MELKELGKKVAPKDLACDDVIRIGKKYFIVRSVTEFMGEVSDKKYILVHGSWTDTFEYDTLVLFSRGTRKVWIPA